jgi:hypothetical protein
MYNPNIIKTKDIIIKKIPREKYGLEISMRYPSGE